MSFFGDANYHMAPEQDKAAIRNAYIWGVDTTWGGSINPYTREAMKNAGIATYQDPTVTTYDGSTTYGGGSYSGDYSGDFSLKGCLVTFAVIGVAVLGLYLWLAPPSHSPVAETPPTASIETPVQPAAPAHRRAARHRPQAVKIRVGGTYRLSGGFTSIPYTYQQGSVTMFSGFAGGRTVVRVLQGDSEHGVYVEDETGTRGFVGARYARAPYFEEISPQRWRAFVAAHGRRSLLQEEAPLAAPVKRKVPAIDDDGQLRSKWSDSDRR
jgi:hypothetical protein